MPKPQIKAIIFDLDGLVLDTEVTYFAAWQQALVGMGLNADLDLQTWSGLAYPAIEQRLLTHFGNHFDLRYFAELSSLCWRDYVQQQGIAVKAGFHALLAWLQQKNIPYCLASNSPGNKARECLNLAGLSEVFSIIITREQVLHPKPHPAIFLQAATAMQISIRHCLVLEDSYPGVLAARHAGAKIAYIPCGAPNPQAQALAHWQYADLLEAMDNTLIV